MPQAAQVVAFVQHSGRTSSVMELIASMGLAWAYSLRRIVSREGEWLFDADCESLGRWPTWFTDTRHLVNMNCYMLRRDVAVQISPTMYRRFRDGLNPDYALCEHLLESGLPFMTTGAPSVNCRLGGSASSVKPGFFVRGNIAMRARYGDKFPWRSERTQARRRTELSVQP